MPVSLDDARGFLTNLFGPAARNVTPIGRGAWSTAFAFELEDAPGIVRFGAHLQDFRKDELAARFDSEALPIPGVYALGTAFGEYFAVSERLPGEYIDEIDGPAMRRLLSSLFAMLDEIRAIDLSGSTGFGMIDGDGNAPFASWGDALLAIAADNPRLPGWRERLAASETGDGPFNAALAELERLTAFAPAERHLIQCDLLHFNVLVEEDRISAVFDWGNALAGDFLYDIAWFGYWAPWFPAWAGIDVIAEAKRHFVEIGLDVPHVDERLRACLLHIGLDNIAYSAFTSNWAQVAEVSTRTLAIARGEPIQ